MSADPISCALLAAASLSTGLRRMANRPNPALSDIPVDPLAVALAAARQRARTLHIPESAISSHLDAARRRGQTELAAMQDLIARTSGTRARG